MFLCAGGWAWEAGKTNFDPTFQTGGLAGEMSILCSSDVKRLNVDGFDSLMFPARSTVTPTTADCCTWFKMQDSVGKAWEHYITS